VKMGIIAEDDSDVAVLRELTTALVRPHQIGFSRFVGDGCGKLRRKCGAWAVNLVRQGCHWILVAHDLDDYEELHLRAELERQIAPANAQARVVLIPKREIEAWLLYDAAAIAAAFRQAQIPRLPGNPEALPDPKKYLRALIRKKYRKEYLNTVHNGAIAKHVDPASLRRCGSFAPQFAFTRDVTTTIREEAANLRGRAHRPRP
jgi:Domain of unknown function (DUF4276)